MFLKNRNRRKARAGEGREANRKRAGAAALYKWFGRRPNCAAKPHRPPLEASRLSRLVSHFRFAAFPISDSGRVISFFHIFIHFKTFRYPQSSVLAALESQNRATIFGTSDQHLRLSENCSQLFFNSEENSMKYIWTFSENPIHFVRNAEVELRAQFTA